MPLPRPDRPRLRRTRRLAAALLALPGLGFAALDTTPSTRLEDDLRCQLGVYALPPGVGIDAVTITGREGLPRGLQYTLSDGRFGALQPDPAGGFAGGPLALRFAPCDEGRLMLTLEHRVWEARRVPLPQQYSRFQGDGVALHGKLVQPAGARAEALLVWLEGSNNDPATDDSVWPYELARRGVAVFVFDKRGTGSSGGAPSADFHLRARDAAAAVREAQRLAPGIPKVGVAGGSQGGWVAPLVGQQLPLDFIIAAFALADGPIAQDKAIVDAQLREAGFDEQARREAEALTALTERIVRSPRLEGLDALETFKARRPAPAWLPAIQPRSYTGLLLATPIEHLRAAGPAMAQGLPFDYDPGPVIASLPQRQLWLLGGQDRQAPNAATQKTLRQLQAQGRPIAVALFPEAGHGLITQRPGTAGTEPAFAAGLFDLTARWILHHRDPAAGEFLTLETSHGR